MSRTKTIGFVLLLCTLCACEKEVCQECEIIRESNEEAVRQSLNKVNGGLVYRLEEEPFHEVENTSFTSCDIDEMERTESLDNLVEVRTFEIDGASVQYQIRWYANCRLIQ